jgi:hypothetical protein
MERGIRESIEGGRVERLEQRLLEIQLGGS